MKITDRQSTRASFRILLVATAIQGLTPDCDNLASSCLLRLVTSQCATSRATDGAAAPMPMPIPFGDQDDAPGELCSAVPADTAVRFRVDPGDQRCQFFPVGLLERLTGSAHRSLDLPGAGSRSSNGLVLSLCRLLC